MIGTSGHREDQNQEPQRTQRNAEEEAQARVPVPHDDLRVVEPSETGGSSARPGAGKYPDTEWLPSVHRAGPGDAWQTIVTHDYKVVKVSDTEVLNLKWAVRRQMGLPEEWASREKWVDYHRRQLALLEKANAAPRCQHIYADGTQCRGPKLREGEKCYAHDRMDAVRPERLRLPALEDANSVVLAVMEIQRALLDGLISEKTAGLLLYSVQIGAWAVQHVTFAETEPSEMVRARPALSSQQSAVSQNKTKTHHGERRGTAKDRNHGGHRGARRKKRPTADQRR